MKKKLLHIMMGQHNPDLQKGLDSVFECVHFDWTIYNGNTYQLNYYLLQKFYEFKPDIIFMHTQCDIITKETLKNMQDGLPKM